MHKSDNNNNNKKKKGPDPKDLVALSKIKKAKTVEGEEEEEETSPPHVIQDNHSEDEVKSVASDAESIASFHKCNCCHNFGHEGFPCYKCEEDACSYFVGRKLNNREMDEAMEHMRKEDDDENEDEEEENY